MRRPCCDPQRRLRILHQLWLRRCVWVNSQATGAPEHGHNTTRIVFAYDRTRCAPALLQAHHLTRRYGQTTVVQDFVVCCRPRRVPGRDRLNGAGKTTTMRMCLGLTEPDAGTIDYFGSDSGRPR